MNPSTLVALEDVSLRFGAVRALGGLQLRVQRGERLALVGANGSGKSSLLRVLHGLAAPSSGSRAAASGIRQAMVFQQPHMLRASVRANVALGLWLGGASWATARAQADAALDLVGLAALAPRWAHQLSGGQKQRLAMARAWALRPDLLFMDEPTASLDPHAKREVEGLMSRFADEGMTLVFSSHNLGQVKRIASRVIYLEAGRVLADLPMADFFAPGRLREVSPEADLFVKGEMG